MQAHVGQDASSDGLNEDPTIERIAQEMIEFDAEHALNTARKRAEEEARIGNIAAATRWRSIADAIKRLLKS